VKHLRRGIHGRGVAGQGSLRTVAAVSATLGLALVGPSVAAAAEPESNKSNGASASNSNSNSNNANSASKNNTANNNTANNNNKNNASNGSNNNNANNNGSNDASSNNAAKKSSGKKTSNKSSANANSAKKNSAKKASNNNSSSKNAPKKDSEKKAPGNAGKAGGKQGGGNGNAGAQANGNDGGAQGGDGSPPGNNGTVKIALHGEIDGIPNNTPHPGCQFQVEWYGFDEGDEIISQVAFAMQPPTGEVDLSVSGDTSVFVGGSPGAGAGNSSRDGVQVYTLGFTGDPHPKQGYHVKLTVETPFSNGNDTKTKVFWVEECEGGSGGGDETPGGGGGSEVGGVAAPGGGDEVAGVDEERSPGGGSPGAPEVRGEQAPGGGNEVAGVQEERSPGGNEVAGVSASRPDHQVAGVAVPTQVAAGVGQQAGGSSTSTWQALLLALAGSLGAVGAWLTLGGLRRRGRSS
jgi:hypothetical protein